MNQKNIIALCLGIIVAGLLWEYYLKPKYDIKMGKEEVEYALHRADIDALEEATANTPGEVLYKSSLDPVTGEEASSSGIDGDGSSLKDDVLNTRNKEDKPFNFSSTANKPRTIFDIAASEDPKDTDIQVAAQEGVIMHPTIIPSSEEQAKENAPEDRITMVLMPAAYKLIKTEKELSAYKKENPGAYPKVDFNRHMLLVLESDKGLSSNFFEIVNVDGSDGKITVDYRVNVLGAANKNNEKAYKVIKKSDKKVVLNQVK